jgi:SAM-dependent methyltransferase
MKDWDDPELRAIQKAMQLPINEPKHRKHWEWAIGMLALQKAGALQENKIALGVGAGKEYPLFWLTNHIRYVLATDLYSVSQRWQNEADSQMLVCPEKFYPLAINRRRLGVMVMDGTRLHFEDNTFDAVFSYSSIEHFGGIDASKRALQEIARVLKPGGAASIASELVVGDLREIKQKRDKGYSILHEVFTPAEMEELIIASGLTMANPLIYQVSKEDLATALLFPEEVAKSPHIVLQYDGIYWSSVHILLFKPQSRMQQICKAFSRGIRRNEFKKFNNYES